MPTNLYGPNDNFDLESSHVLPALIRNFHLAKLASRGDLEALQQDESLFGPIPEDLKAVLLVEDGGLPASMPPSKEWQRDRGSVIRQFQPSLPSVICHLALLRQLSTANRTVVVWGTGNARREFLHVDDLAAASVFLMNRYEDPEHINVGVGSDLTIKELAETVKDIVFPEAKLVFDQSKPDGTPQKLLDLSRLSNLGWQPKITFSKGIQETYKWYLSQTQ